MKAVCSWTLGILLFFVLFAGAAIGAVQSFDATQLMCDNPAECAIKPGCGRSGGSCVVITGTGITDSYTLARSPSVATTPMTTRLITAYVKCSVASRSGTPLVGFGSANADVWSCGTLAADAGNGWQRFEFVARTPSVAPSKPYALTVGHWQINGTCFFDGFSVADAEVLAFNDAQYGQMGRAESVAVDGTYTSVVLGGSCIDTTNYHRQTVAAPQSFNTNRYQFASSANGALVHSHGLKVAFLSAPTVTFEVRSYRSGSLVVESSSDNTNWANVGTASADGTFTFGLPSAASRYVRFTSGTTTTSLQLSKYMFTAKVAAPSDGIPHTGADVTSVSTSASASPVATLSILGSSTAPSAGTLPIRVTSTQSFEQATLTATPEQTSSVATVAPSSQAISSLSTTTFTLSYALAGAQKRIELALVASGTTLATALLRFSPRCILFDDSYGQLLNKGTSSTLWWCGSTYKVHMYRNAPATPEVPTGVIGISAAKGEKEPFQLVVKAGASAVTISAISVGALAGPSGASIGSDSISVRRVRHLHISRPSDHYGMAGTWWPDPLVPLTLPFVCPAKTNCPFWVLVSVPMNATEGRYKGAVSVTSSGATTTSTLDLLVRNFTIPKHTSLKSWFGLSLAHMRLYHNVPSTVNWAGGEPLWDRYLRSFSAHRLTPAPVMMFHDIWADPETVAGKVQWHYYLDNFRKNVEKYYGDSGYGFSTYGIQLKGLGNDAAGSKIEGYAMDSPEYTRLFNNYTATVQNVLEETGMLDKSFVYWFDEPTEADYPFVKSRMTAIRTAGPKIKRFLTEQYESDLDGYVDIWSPVQANYVNGFAASRKPKENTWTYVCCCPRNNLGLFIDHPAVDLRAWLWLVYKEGIDGILVWESNYWTSPEAYPNATSPQDPYEDAMSWTRGETPAGEWGNGDGRFFYPPENWKSGENLINTDPVESIRLELLREGVEDWEYLRILEELVRNTRLSPDKATRAAALLNVPKSIIDTDTSYNLVPDELLRRRSDIADMIEEIAASGSYPVSSGTQGDVSSAMHNGVTGAAATVIVAVAACIAALAATL